VLRILASQPRLAQNGKDHIKSAIMAYIRIFFEITLHFEKIIIILKRLFRNSEFLHECSVCSKFKALKKLYLAR
jgi:hypothetical protein